MLDADPPSVVGTSSMASSRAANKQPNARKSADPGDRSPSAGEARSSSFRPLTRWTRTTQEAVLEGPDGLEKVSQEER